MYSYNLDVLQVAWIKSDSKAILAIHTHMVAQNARLSVTHNGHNTWKLHISNVQKNDSGTYMCQINTDPMRSQVGIYIIARIKARSRPGIRRFNHRGKTFSGIKQRQLSYQL